MNHTFPLLLHRKSSYTYQKQGKHCKSVIPEINWFLEVFAQYVEY